MREEERLSPFFTELLRHPCNEMMEGTEPILAEVSSCFPWQDGQHLLVFISEIRIFRGEKDPERPYAGSPAVIENILEIADTSDKESLEIRDRMTAKLLEVMNVGEEDITLMREYLQAIDTRTQLMNQVYALQKDVDKLPTYKRILPTEKIRALRRQADRVVRDVVGKIEARYPRKRSFGKI